MAYLPQTLRLIWAAAPRWTLVWGVLLCLQGLLPVGLLYFTRLLVDSLVAAIGADDPWQNAGPVMAFSGLLAGVLLLNEFLQSISDWIRSAQSELVQDYINSLIHKKSATVDLAFYESSDYYDQLYRARSDASSRSLSLLENSGHLLQNGITLLGMASLLLPYGVAVPFILLISTAPALYVVYHFNRRYHQWWQRTTPERRWAQYYDTMLTHNSVAAELRLFDLGPYFCSAYQSLRQRLRDEFLNFTRKQGIARAGAGLLALGASGAVMAWMLWRALHGLATLGDLVLFYQAFTRGQGVMRSLLGNVGQIYANTLFLGNLFEFLGLTTKIANPDVSMAPPRTLQRGIAFRDITFRYPGSKRTALQDFSLEIPAGQVVAIVGANGAGKSTLVKLLCRFYDPERGSIELDGIDIRALEVEDLRRMITVLFQWPVAYHATAANNIAMGDLQATPSVAEVERAARGAGAHQVIARLPHGYDTLLGKWFAEGTELSSGEWQRIALARAFLRSAQIIILDEPTSFMDSWAEVDWLARFRNLAEGRTAMLITHRFTTAMYADVIHVMDAGKIVESGSHDELAARGGLYAQSWAAQMRGAATVAAPTNGSVSRVEV